MDPPAPADRLAGPTRVPRSQKPKPIGNLGHVLHFVAIGKLGNALDFRTIGNLGNAIHFVNIGHLGHDLVFVAIGNIGNGFLVANIANDFGWLHAFGCEEGEKPKIIGQIGKIVMV